MIVQYFKKVYSFIRKPYEFYKRHARWKRTKYYLISYPKSGRTWIRFFLRDYLSSYYQIPVSETLLSKEKESSPYPNILITHYGYHGEVLRFKDRLTLVYKNKATLLKNIKKMKNENIIFLYRDPRDVVVSFYYYLSKNLEVTHANNVTLSEFLRDPDRGIVSIITYMNLWYKNRNIFKSFRMISYESARGDTELEFSKLLETMRIPINQKLLHEKVKAYEFNEMKKKEQSQMLERLKPINTNDPDAAFVRRGKIGGYKDYFDEDDLVFIHQAMQKLNPAFGYKQ